MLHDKESKEFQYFSKRHPLRPSTSFCKTADGRYEKGELLAETLWGESRLYKFKDREGKVTKVVKEVVCYNEDQIEERKREVEIYRQVRGYCEMQILPLNDSEEKEKECLEDDSENEGDGEDNRKLVRIITDYIDAQTLAEKLSKGMDPVEILILLFNFVIELQKFNLQWIHIDLHEENILFDAKGTAYLIDFHKAQKKGYRYSDNIGGIETIIEYVLKKTVLPMWMKNELTDLAELINNKCKEKNSLSETNSLYAFILEEISFLKSISSLSDIKDEASFAKIKATFLEAKILDRVIITAMKGQLDEKIIQLFLQDKLNLKYANNFEQSLGDVAVCSSPAIIEIIFKYLQKCGEEKLLVSSFIKMSKNMDLDMLKSFKKFYPAEFKKYLSSPDFYQALSSVSFLEDSEKIDFFIENNITKSLDFTVIVQEGFIGLMFDNRYSEIKPLSKKLLIDIPDFVRRVPAASIQKSQGYPLKELVEDTAPSTQLPLAGTESCSSSSFDFQPHTNDGISKEKNKKRKLSNSIPTLTLKPF